MKLAVQAEIEMVRTGDSLSHQGISKPPFSGLGGDLQLATTSLKSLTNTNYAVIVAAPQLWRRTWRE
jgi:hypothetical protein